MTYWYADFPIEPSQLPYDASRHKRAWAELTSLVAEISSKQSFPLTNDEKMCGYCPYRSYCERGVQADEGESIESEISSLDVSLEQIQEIEF